LISAVTFLLFITSTALPNPVIDCIISHSYFVAANLQYFRKNLYILRQKIPQNQ